jgi:enoyl-CoA hydratase
MAEMTATMYKTFLVEVQDYVAQVRFNRPDKANALNQTAWEELQAIFEDLDERPDVRAIILSGEGKNFCAGIDLEMLVGFQQVLKHPDEGRKREKLRKMILTLQKPINAIEDCSKPVLAAIHRACVGGGIDITSACDMRYCTADAFFSIEEINIGMVADLGTLQRLPKLIGQGIVRELAFSGRRMLADEALQRQFANQVYDDKDTMMANVLDIAKLIAAKSPLSVRGTKQILNHSRDHSVADGLNYMATWNAAMFLSNDVQEALSAKFEGREPNFED